MTVLEYLQQHRGPVTIAEICGFLGVPRRAVEEAIQMLRLDGHPVVTSSDGVWLGTADEVEACSRRLRSRFIHQAITARALRRTARRMRGVEQTELWAA